MHRIPAISLLAVLAILVTGLPAAGQSPRAKLRGVVLDARSGKPVADALVRLLEAEVSVETTERGRFTFPAVDSGTYTIVVERLGYETRRDVVVLGPGVDIDATIRFSEKPVELEPIEVTVRSDKLTEVGYYDRRDNGGIKGHYITHDDLVRRNALGLTDALVDVPSVRVHNLGISRTTVRFNRHVPEVGPGGHYALQGGGPIPGCEPDLYIDGRLYRNSSPPIVSGGGMATFAKGISKVDDFNAVAVSDIEGVEVYVGAAVPPFVYQTACGVILIWTRR